jgi:hypothetical protein
MLQSSCLVSLRPACDIQPLRSERVDRNNTVCFSMCCPESTCIERCRCRQQDGLFHECCHTFTICTYQ